MSELPASDEMLGARDLNYCPLHGEALDAAEWPVECPTCGPVNVDFWRTEWEAPDAEVVRTSRTSPLTVAVRSVAAVGVVACAAAAVLFATGSQTAAVPLLALGLANVASGAIALRHVGGDSA